MGGSATAVACARAPPPSTCACGDRALSPCRCCLLLPSPALPFHWSTPEALALASSPLPACAHARACKACTTAWKVCTLAHMHACGGDRDLAAARPRTRPTHTTTTRAHAATACARARQAGAQPWPAWGRRSSAHCSALHSIYGPKQAKVLCACLFRRRRALGAPALRLGSGCKGCAPAPPPPPWQCMQGLSPPPSLACSIILARWLLRFCDALRLMVLLADADLE